MSLFTDLVFEAGLVARSLGDYFSGGGLRLGVTGLSRSGKTVFLTAIVNNLIAGANLPVLAASAEGRITRARLEPQPDDAVPRFAYEDHLASLTGPERAWPQSTRRISQLRLTIEFESAVRWTSKASSLSLDLVDYPGEWLLDLPLLEKSYATWARETLAASETPGARSSLDRVARSAQGPRPARSGQRGQGARNRRALHRLSAQGARERLCALDTAARALPDARRPRRLARPHLRADPLG